MSHWSALQGQATNVDKNGLKEIFNSMDKDNNGFVTLEQYSKTLTHRPGTFSRFDLLNGTK